MKFVLTIILILFLALQASPITECDKANAEYEKGNFTEAITLYNSIVKSGYENGEIYYNLGNSYYQTGDLVNTIVNYERALKFIPGDNDLLDNLKIVKLSLIDKEEAEKPEPFFNFISKLRNYFNIYSIRTFFLLTMILISVLLSLSIIFRFSRISKMINVLNVGLFIIFLFLAYIYHSINSDISREFAVVNNDKISVLSSPDENVNSKELFFLHIGTKVELIRYNDDWYEITLSGDKKGWVKKESVVKI
ncbi:MAG: tetratricopeptide repeat protein [Candidatus Delongbacteria bacterium]|nr:tetratricopeptide repeat protein [Candidatus Delongbacteria bacterium]